MTNLEQEEPIYIFSYSKSGTDLYSRLSILANAQGEENPYPENVKNYKNKLKMKGLTRHEFYEVAKILKEYNY
jgi:hypothetical protein